MSRTVELTPPAADCASGRRTGPVCQTPLTRKWPAARLARASKSANSELVCVMPSGP
jgi:hypothetical protein